MGQTISNILKRIFEFPVRRRSVCFERDADYNAAGKLRTADKKDNAVNINATLVGNYYEDSLNQLYSDVIKERKRIRGCREYFATLDPSILAKEYEGWDEEVVKDLKTTFLILDVNEDGVIDFKELCQVLDSAGHESQERDRLLAFADLDKDNSGVLDFKEFLDMMHGSATGKSSNIVADLCKEISSFRKYVDVLSCCQQIRTGLF